MEPIYCYKKDNNLKYSNENFEEVLNSSQYDEDAASCTPFPSDYLLAQFADLAYSETFVDLPADWELLTTARNKTISNGYFGVSFWNPKFCHVVVSHRGTQISSIGALISDIKLSLNWKKTNRAESAATFVHKVGEAIKVKMSNDGPRYQLSITGHSLGAWLAQMTTFTLKFFTLHNDQFVEDHKYTNNIHAHTVGFESPGCKGNMEGLSKHFVPSLVKRKFGNYYSLDMTIYLSEINFINCVNQHVGTIYKIASKTHRMKEVLNQFDKNTGDIKRELVLDSKSGLLASLKAIFKPVTGIKFKTITACNNQHSLNVFDENEEDFIRDWLYIRDYHPDSIRNVKSLPNFKVDYEYDLIKGDNILRTIARIKNYKTTKSFVSNVLTAQVLFKMRTDQYKTSLTQYCDGLYIKDKYGMSDFLISNKRILKIAVKADMPDGCCTESSILNNVCTFYKMTQTRLEYFENDKYHFISWDYLYTVLKSHPTVFEDIDIKLLVLECSNFSEYDEQAINSFLSGVTFKVVILTDGKLSFTEDKSVMDADGFSHAVIFDDLEKETQTRLLEQKHVLFNNKPMSIKSYLKFSQDTYKHLNSALPPDLLLHLLTVPDTEHLVLDTSYQNILTGITIDIFQKIDMDINNIESIRNSLLFIENSENSTVALPSILQHSNDFETKCIENLNTKSKKIIYLFTVKDNNMYLSKIFRSDLYLKRNICHQRLVKSSVFKNLDPNQFFYVCGDKNIFEKKYAHVDPERYIYISEEEPELTLQRTKAIAHVLKLEDHKTIRWLASTGNIQFIKKHLIIEEVLQKSASEEDLANEHIVILSGEAGEGKSSVIKMLYLYLQKTHWVFALQLANANFENFTLNFHNVTKFILNSCGIAGEYIQFLLSFSLRYKTNIPIYLMFDGFDQVSNAEDRKTFISIINYLKFSPNAKILITTRPYYCEQLENGISVPASYYLSTNSEASIIDYLTKFWFSQLQVLRNDVDFKDLQKSAKYILNETSHYFGDKISSLLGIPLHIRIIAEIFSPNVLSINDQNVFSDFLLPYQKLVETHCYTYFRRSDFPENEFLKNIALEGIYEKMYKLAMIHLFHFDMEFRIEKEIEELNKIGLVQSNTNILNFSFLHDTVRDYFIANLLNSWLEGKLTCSDWEVDYFFICNFLLKPQHKDVRIFLNCYLKTAKVSSNTLNICFERLKTVFAKNQKLLFNESDTFYHVCLEENLDFLFKNFLIELIDVKDVSTALLCQRNSKLKTPLLLLIENIETYHDVDEDNLISLFLKKVNELPTEYIKQILLSTFFVHLDTPEIFKTATDIASPFENIHQVFLEIQTPYSQIDDFLNACLLNKSKIFMKILQPYDDHIKQSLVTVTNSKLQNGLHLTISETIISEMLKLGADINFQEHHGLTPLLRAVIRGKISIVSLFIDNGADVTIPDYYDNSPLVHAAKHGHEDIVNLLLDSNLIDVKQCNRFGNDALMLAARNGNENIVKSLLQRYSSVNETDQTGLSPLFHCVKTNQIHLIKHFRRKGADVNVQDIHGVTPLLDSIKKSNWKAVNELLDSGADPLIGSYYNQYALKLLIQKDRNKILNKILSKTQISTSSSVMTSINIEELDYLTDKDKSYLHKCIQKKLTTS